MTQPTTTPQPIAWEIKNHRLKHHLTDAEYWKLSSKVRQWYRPYKPPVPESKPCNANTTG